MIGTVDILLQRPEALHVEIAERAARPRRAFALLGVTVAGTALFGAAVGSYIGGGQILHAAVKMPILFLGTLGVTLPLMHVAAAIFGTGYTFSQTALLCLTSIALTGTILGGTAPVMMLFALSAPYPSYNSYLWLVLLMVACIALAGGVSVAALHRGMRAAARSGADVLRTIACWLVVYHFVGGQMAWLLRPFVGDNRDVFGGFSLERNLQGNIYEGIVNAFLAALRTSGN